MMHNQTKGRSIIWRLGWVGLACMLFWNVAYATQVPLSQWEYKREDGIFTTITLPHSTNAQDAGDYYQGKTYYKANVISVPNAKTYIASFEGAGQTATVYLNGHVAGSSCCGYIPFSVDLSPYVQDGDNDLLVVLDNSAYQNIIPVSGDFNFANGY